MTLVAGALLAAASLAVASAPQVGASGSPDGWTAAGGAGVGALASVSCPDAGHCWASGTSGSSTLDRSGSGIVAATTDFGAHWNVQATTTSVPVLDAVSCPSDLFCLAVGSTDTSPTAGVSDFPISPQSQAAGTASADGGATWAPVALPSQTGDHAIAASCADDQHCVVAGYNINSSYVGVPITFATSDGGGTWNRSPLPYDSVQTARFGDGVTCPDGLHCWVSVESGEVVATADGGTTWSLVRAAPTGGDIYQLDSIDCPSLTQCMTAGAHPVLTEDGGRTWPLTGMALSRRSRVDCPTAEDCRAVSDNGQQGRQAAVTHDFGQTWSYSLTPENDGSTTAPMTDVACPSIPQCIAVGNPAAPGQPVSWTTRAGGVFGGYWLVASDGGVFTFGEAGFHGSDGGRPLPAPVVAVAPTPDGGGYWLARSDGSVSSFGDAQYHGSMAGQPISGRVVDIASSLDGGGYFLATSTGAVYAFGDAQYAGGVNSKPLNAPIVGMAVHPGGYWLVAAGGGVFNPNNSPGYYFGSMGGRRLARPVVGMAATPDAGGYWLVASDGGIFTFGDAGFYGSLGALRLNAPVVGMTAPDSGGYWLVASDGGIFTFGDPRFYGSTGGMRLNKPIVGMS